MIMWPNIEGYAWPRTAEHFFPPQTFTLLFICIKLDQLDLETEMGSGADCVAGLVLMPGMTAAVNGIKFLSFTFQNEMC